MDAIEKYVRSHEFKDVTASHLTKSILEDTGNEYNARQVGLCFGQLVKSKIITRRILKGRYLYSSKAVGLPPAPPALHAPLLTVQTATPAELNTVQFSAPYVTPYAPDEKYGEIQAELDQTLNALDSYKSLYRDMLSALRQSYASCDSNMVFLAGLATKLNLAI